MNILKAASILTFLVFPLFLYGQQNYYSTIDYEEINKKIIVPVNIEGKSYRFMLDTGAPCCVSKELASLLHLNPDTFIITNDANNTKGNIGITTLNQIQIGDVLFDSITVMLGDDDNIFSDCLAVDGVVGSNLLRQSILQIRNQEKKIILTNEISNIEVDTANSMEMEVYGKQAKPLIRIKYISNIKKRTLVSDRVLFDTGDNGFYTHSLDGYQHFKKNNIAPKVLRKAVISTGFGFNGRAPKRKNYTLGIPNLKICNTQFKNISASTTYGNSRLGAKLLTFGDVVVDFINGKFYFIPYKTEEPIDAKMMYLPIQYSFKGDTLIVGAIFDKKLKKKINVGDEILSFNNVNFEELELCDYFKDEHIFKDEKVLLKVRSADGDVSEILIRREYLKKQKIY